MDEPPASLLNAGQQVVRAADYVLNKHPSALVFHKKAHTHATFREQVQSDITILKEITHTVLGAGGYNACGPQFQKAMATAATSALLRSSDVLQKSWRTQTEVTKRPAIPELRAGVAASVIKYAEVPRELQASMHHVLGLKRRCVAAFRRNVLLQKKLARRVARQFALIYERRVRRGFVRFSLLLKLRETARMQNGLAAWRGGVRWRKVLRRVWERHDGCVEATARAALVGWGLVAARQSVLRRKALLVTGMSDAMRTSRHMKAWARAVHCQRAVAAMEHKREMNIKRKVLYALALARFWARRREHTMARRVLVAWSEFLRDRAAAVDVMRHSVMCAAVSRSFTLLHEHAAMQKVVRTCRSQTRRLAMRRGMWCFRDNLRRATLVREHIQFCAARHCLGSWSAVTCASSTATRKYMSIKRRADGRYLSRGFEAFLCLHLDTMLRHMGKVNRLRWQFKTMRIRCDGNKEERLMTEKAHLRNQAEAACQVARVHFALKRALRLLGENATRRINHRLNVDMATYYMRRRLFSVLGKKLVRHWLAAARIAHVEREKLIAAGRIWALNTVVRGLDVWKKVMLRSLEKKARNEIATVANKARERLGMVRTLQMWSSWAHNEVQLENVFVSRQQVLNLKKRYLAVWSRSVRLDMVVRGLAWTSLVGSLFRRWKDETVGFTCLRKDLADLHYSRRRLAVALEAWGETVLSARTLNRIMDIRATNSLLRCAWAHWLQWSALKYDSRMQKREAFKFYRLCAIRRFFVTWAVAAKEGPIVVGKAFVPRVELRVKSGNKKVVLTEREVRDFAKAAVSMTLAAMDENKVPSKGQKKAKRKTHTADARPSYTGLNGAPVNKERAEKKKLLKKKLTSFKHHSPPRTPCRVTKRRPAMAERCCCGHPDCEDAFRQKDQSAPSKQGSSQCPSNSNNKNVTINSARPRRSTSTKAA